MQNINLTFNELDLLKYILNKINNSVKESKNISTLNDLSIALLPEDIEALKTLTIKLQ